MVTRLKPRQADIETALRAFREANFDFCAEALAENNSLEALALRARSLVRAGRHDEVLALVGSLRMETLSHDYAAEFLALQIASLGSIGDPLADSIVVEARVRAYSSGCAAIECEVEYASASLAWKQCRTTETLQDIEKVLSVAEQQPIWSRQPRDGYPYSTEYWRSRALGLRSVVQASTEDFVGQALSIQQAFVELDQSAVSDSLFEASMVFNIAVLMRDLDCNELGAAIEDRAKRFEWTGDTAYFEFEVFRALGWCAARTGNHIGALRSFRRATECAPTPAFKIIAILDRSFLARELGEMHTSDEDLEYCGQLSKQVDWEHASLFERAALYSLAAQVAPRQSEQSRRLLDRYLALKSSGSNLLSSKRDRRQRAEECTATARVILGEGHRERAISLFLESFAIWNSVGYSWRAATVALDLAELTGEPRYFRAAEREASRQPNSWLARRFESLTSSRGASALQR